MKNVSSDELLDFVLENNLVVRMRPRSRKDLEKGNPKRTRDYVIGVTRSSSDIGLWWQTWGVGATKRTALNSAFRKGPRGYDD